VLPRRPNFRAPGVTAGRLCAFNRRNPRPPRMSLYAAPAVRVAPALNPIQTLRRLRAPRAQCFDWQAPSRWLIPSLCTRRTSAQRRQSSTRVLGITAVRC